MSKTISVGDWNATKARFIQKWRDIERKGALFCPHLWIRFPVTDVKIPTEITANVQYPYGVLEETANLRDLFWMGTQWYRIEKCYKCGKVKLVGGY